MSKKVISTGIIVFTLLLSMGCSSKAKHQKTSNQPKQKKQDTLRFSPEREAFFYAYFDSLHQRGLFNGNILVAEKDSLFKASFGYSEIRKKEPLSINDRFQLASVSKPLTAYATLILADSGLINLQDSLQAYLPDFPYEGITIHQLLSHRSGLSNYMYVTDSAWTDKDLALCNDEAYSIFCEEQPMRYYPPDTRFDYCNTNYFLLAHIIEEVTQIPFESFMAKELFDPLGMFNTRVYTNMTYWDLPDVAIGSNAYGNPKVDFYLNGVSGDKGVFSTVENLYAFHLELLQPQLTQKKWVDLMFQPKSKFSSRGNSYGYGFRLHQEVNDTLIYHKGWWRGYRSYFYHFPKGQAAIIALTNTTKGQFLEFKDLFSASHRTLRRKQRP